jgi:hypothetical protein
MTNETSPPPPIATRVAAVLGGYLVAALVAALVVRIAYAGVPDAEISHGMAAFGMALLYFLAFGGMAMVHSGLLIYWLRGRVRLWLLALGAAPAALASFVLGFFLMSMSV